MRRQRSGTGPASASGAAAGVSPCRPSSSCSGSAERSHPPRASPRPPSRAGTAGLGKSARRVPPARPRPPRPRGATPKERDRLTHGSAAGEAGDTSGFRGAGEVNCTEVQVVFSPIRSGRLKEGEHTHALAHTHTHTRTRPLGSASELPQQGGARTENTRAARYRRGAALPLPACLCGVRARVCICVCVCVCPRSPRPLSRTAPPGGEVRAAPGKGAAVPSGQRGRGRPVRLGPGDCEPCAAARLHACCFLPARRRWGGGGRKNRAAAGTRRWRVSVCVCAASPPLRRLPAPRGGGADLVEVPRGEGVRVSIPTAPHAPPPCDSGRNPPPSPHLPSPGTAPPALSPPSSAPGFPLLSIFPPLLYFQTCPRAATPSALAAAPFGQAVPHGHLRFEVAEGAMLRDRAGGLPGLGMRPPEASARPAPPLPHRAGSGVGSRRSSPLVLLTGVSPHAPRIWKQTSWRRTLAMSAGFPES
ncbi:transcription initiation factor TFIID subunit 4-like [Pipra filicauda]|uniref:Transcription initiation factor TFIID subunit 4-like n=1 Tax=Pipra filicauda TaxID=649802 RepID=A0A7R5L6T2_9PASS|nr:transcription initiation factor TFIID subunit 4-like [Pipra filicauda]